MMAVGKPPYSAFPSPSLSRLATTIWVTASVPWRASDCWMGSTTGKWTPGYRTPGEGSTIGPLGVGDAIWTQPLASIADGDCPISRNEPCRFRFDGFLADRAAGHRKPA